MNDDTPTNLAAEAEAPEIEQEVEETLEAETEGSESESADEGELTEEELYELERDGKKYKVPAALKDDFLRQSDYTKKTQELADQRRAFEDQGKTFAEQQKALTQHVLEVSKLVSIDEQLAQYDKVDWQAWGDLDAVAAQKGWFEKERLKEARNSLGQKLAQEHNDRVTREQQETAKRIDEGLAVIKKEIPNWSQEYADKLTEHAKKVVPNATAEQLRQVQLVNPGFVVFLDKAHKYDQIVAKQRERASAGQAATPVTPVTTVGQRRAPASNEPDPKDAEAWAAWRNSQVAKRRTAGR